MKAEAEFKTFRQAQAALPAPVDQHFDEVIDEVKRLEQTTPQPEKPRGRKGKDKETADG